MPIKFVSIEEMTTLELLSSSQRQVYVGIFFISILIILTNPSFALEQLQLSNPEGPEGQSTVGFTNIPKSQKKSHPNISNMKCGDLWRMRNQLFADVNYCFRGEKGRRIFGNAGCFRSNNQAWRAMSKSNQKLVTQIRRQESVRGC